MKYLSSILIAVCLIAAPATFTGCSSTPRTREAIVYFTFHDIQAGVNEAMNVFSERVVRQRVTLSQQDSVEKAYRDYQAAFRVAFALAQSDLSRPAPENVTKLSEILINLIYSL